MNTQRSGPRRSAAAVGAKAVTKGEFYCRESEIRPRLARCRPRAEPVSSRSAWNPPPDAPGATHRGIPPAHVRAQLQSHGLGGVQARHYDRHDYMDEKRDALRAWERRLAQIAEGKSAKIISAAFGTKRRAR